MAYNRTYQISGEAGLNTTITPQADLISDIRSIEGITIVTFTPKNEDESAASNPNHLGILSIKFDTFIESLKPLFIQAASEKQISIKFSLNASASVSINPDQLR